MTRVYLSPPEVGAEERRMLLEAFDSNWIAPLGPDVDAFEAEFAARVGAGHAVALSSGTAALHLALLLCGVGPGDEVLVPSFTFVATANAVVYLGARPGVRRLPPPTPGPSTRSWWPTSWTGGPPPGDCRPPWSPSTSTASRATTTGCWPTCDRHGVPLVEDAAEALGATYRGRQVGSFGRMGVFSFNGNKIITTSGGGMLVTGSAEEADRARFLATQAREPFPHYEHTTIGYNYRLSNLLAALGRAQLAGLDSRIDRRRALNRRYRDGLGDVAGLGFMPIADYGEPNYWLTCVTIDPERFGTDRETVRLALEDRDIESRPTWKPLHLQPVFAGCATVGGAQCAAIFERGLCLPTGSALAPGDQDRVIGIVRGLARA